MISSLLYPAFALDTSQPCNTIILPRHWPSSHIYVTDTNESEPYIPLADHTAIFHDDDVWNTSSQPRTIHVTLTIRDQYTGQQVFNQTQSLQMQPCSGPESVKWRFVPIQDDYYHATVSDNRGNVGMIFYSIIDATKSQTVSLPLEQFRFGVNSHSVICRQDLQLVIKSEDGTPACVKPDTAQKLIGRGWATITVTKASFDVMESNMTQMSKESIRIIPEYPISTGINKNGTITDSETIEILFDNFKQTNSPLVIQILNPHGEIYKVDNIPHMIFNQTDFTNTKSISKETRLSWVSTR